VPQPATLKRAPPPFPIRKLIKPLKSTIIPRINWRSYSLSPVLLSHTRLCQFMASLFLCVSIIHCNKTLCQVCDLTMSLVALNIAINWVTVSSRDVRINKVCHLVSITDSQATLPSDSSFIQLNWQLCKLAQTSNLLRRSLDVSSRIVNYITPAWGYKGCTLWNVFTNESIMIVVILNAIVQYFLSLLWTLNTELLTPTICKSPWLRLSSNKMLEQTLKVFSADFTGTFVTTNYK
jgi:hypothetical protein